MPEPAEIVANTPFDNAWRFLVRAGLHKYVWDTKTESYHLQAYDGIVNSRHVVRIEKSSFNGVEVFGVHIDRSETLYAYRHGNDVITRRFWLDLPTSKGKKP